MGRLFLDAISQRDFPYISGILLVSGSVGALILLTADVLRAWLDSRVCERGVEPVGWGAE